jgi:hypothetical protein
LDSSILSPVNFDPPHAQLRRTLLLVQPSQGTM